MMSSSPATLHPGQYWLVCYDIHNNRQRRKANRLLRQFSLSYQDSGLETRIAGDIRPTLEELLPLLQRHDRLLLLPLSQPQPDWQLGQRTPLVGQDSPLLVWA